MEFSLFLVFIALDGQTYIRDKGSECLEEKLSPHVSAKARRSIGRVEVQLRPFLPRS
jgi:hypothetical protein